MLHYSISALSGTRCSPKTPLYWAKISRTAKPSGTSDCILPRHLPQHLPEDLTVVRTAPFYLEIIPKIINKGQGILHACEYLGIQPEEVVAFGDAENDISMIKVAGMGIAMGNAEEEVKKIADRITLTNNENGIAAVLEQIL